ncbi:MAG: response regulator transcription factor [Rhodospirillales bacterium]|nr:MAG: response regulator transcription factor [Rhodospirillales bacterium]
MKVFLIEDNHRLASYVSVGLGKAGFAVDTMATATDGEEAMAVSAYDAVILDLGLPDHDGMDLLTKMRRNGDTTIVLVLTARDALDDRVKGLTAGADDYLVKPFAMAELAARLRALERRQPHALELVLSRGNVQFDPSSREVRVGGGTVPLRRREGDALEYLLRRAGRVVSRTAMEEALYPAGEELASNAIDVLIHRLRKRMQDAEADVSIVTMRGVGYMLSVRTP